MSIYLRQCEVSQSMLLIYVLTNMNKHAWFVLVIFKQKRADSVFAARIFRNWTLTCSMHVSPYQDDFVFEK